MNFSILFIIIDIISLVSNTHINQTKNDTCHVCSISLFRRKRANGEYTRWNANPDTSPEFIVKIMDDDVTTPRSKQIVAVNVQPGTNGGEKIIFGGARGPPPRERENLIIGGAPLYPEKREDENDVVSSRVQRPSNERDNYIITGARLPHLRREEENLVIGEAQLSAPSIERDNFIVNGVRVPPPPRERGNLIISGAQVPSPPKGGENMIMSGARVSPIPKEVDNYIIGGVRVPPPPTKRDKFIVSGVRAPPTTSVTILDKDYTRFVPPTIQDPEVTLLVPVPRPVDDLMLSVLPKGRDESPPASPQFIPRSPSANARQYAPIAPVLFTRRSTLTPLTPRKKTHKTTMQPTRTFPNLDMAIPMRTSGLIDFTPIEFRDEGIPFRTTASIDDSPQRTPVIQKSSYEEKTIDLEKQKDQKIEKETEPSYNNIFYNDEDSESVTTIKYPASLLMEKYDEGRRMAVNDLTIVTEKGLTEVVVDEFYDRKHHTMSADDEEESQNITLLLNASPRLLEGRRKGLSSSKIKRVLACSILKTRQLNFNTPRTLHELVTQLKQWAENSPVAKWVDITNGNYTVMENPIYMMIVDDPSRGQIVSAKQTVMVVAGVQGKDHHTVAAAMYLLYQLIERSEAHSDLLTKYRFWIVPVLNPDGYDYTMTFPRKRDWTKNLRQSWDCCKGPEMRESCEMYGLRCTIKPCFGVNLDRNFEYQWIPTKELNADHPCGVLFAGERQLSEVESHALTHYLHEQKTTLYTFIVFKEGDVLGVMYPYSHTKKRRSFDHSYRQKASSAAAAAYSISGRPYVAGQTSEFLPLYAGGIEDWVDGHLGIDNTYTVMMFRPTDSHNSKLVTERVVHEAYAATDTLLLQTDTPLSPPQVTIIRASRGLLSAFSSRAFVAFAALVIMLGYG